MSNKKIQGQRSDGEICSDQNESDQLQDSESDLFTNLAPTSSKNSINHSKDQSNRILLAKMKRLIGTAYVDKNDEQNKKNSINAKKKAQRAKRATVSKAYCYCSESEQENKIQNSMQIKINSDSLRETKAKHNQYIIDSDSQLEELSKSHKRVKQAGTFSVQKQEVKQNRSLNLNTITGKKSVQKGQINEKISVRQMKQLKFAQMEKHLFLPVEQLPGYQEKTMQEARQEKRQKKRIERRLQKKYKEYKVGKVKDQISNCVFNGIEDYFT